MSRIDRRTMLKGTATVGAVVAVPLAGSAANAATRLVVFDSGIAESQAFAGATQGVQAIDVAREHGALWAGLRGRLPQAAEIEGLTGWSDLVAIRSELERRGMRLVSQAPVSAPLSGKAHLFRWSMQRR
ncbi:MAG: hypothetical protein R3D89_13990 [Sphingomonadaceae bacterium]